MTPRPASEQLVAAALERICDRPARVVDVGTGSGAIALAIAAAAPAADVWATDNSRCAVALAKANVRLHGLGHQVTVVHGDMLEGVPAPIDVVVANLPYLPIGDAVHYPELTADPSAAIFGAGDGLGAYRRLLAVCENGLTEEASVVIQLHRSILAASVSDLPMLATRLAVAA
jgi:release factor glutamine methyltransferase